MRGADRCLPGSGQMTLAGPFSETACIEAEKTCGAASRQSALGRTSVVSLLQLSE
jgi:hypothetical protein